MRGRRARRKQQTMIMTKGKLKRRLPKALKTLTCNKKTRMTKSRRRRNQRRKNLEGRERCSKSLVRVPSPCNHRSNISAVSPENTTGLRRGKRLRYEPLEWWRCEKVVYGRREPGKKTYVPTIKEIVRIPKDPPKSLGIVTHKGKRGTSARKKTEEPSPNFDPEEGWDDKTPTNGVVIDWFTGNEVSRRTSILLYRIVTQLFEQTRRSCFPRSLGKPSPGCE
jgi:hypothetical protein